MPSSNRIWFSNYEILKEYYEENGAVDTLNTYKTNVSLHNWVASQRRAYRSSSRTDLNKRHIYLLNQIEFDWSPTRTMLLNSDINPENSLEYNKTLIQRLNNIIDDLVLEGINEIYEDNQKEIEKIMIKRIWR